MKKYNCRVRIGQDSVTWYDQEGKETMTIDSSNKVTVTQPKLQPETNNIIFYNGTEPLTKNEVMRISSSGVKVNQNFPMDEATDAVIRGLDGYIKNLAQKEYERGFEDARTKLKEKNQ